jgi:CubicO group peptidase (beta-lactamase class C family)
MDQVKLEAFVDFLGGRGAVVRYGYMTFTWGDQAYDADLASADKPIYTTLLLMAAEQGRLSSLDQRIDTFEPCVDSINPDLGHKDRNITFRQMANQISDYGVQESPGSAFDYNDWQMALFVDTLMLKVWGSGTWSNVDATVLYPDLANVLQMQDSPSMDVAGLDQGRVSMSVRDFARLGLLYLRQGKWNSTQVLSQQDAVMAVTSPVASTIPRTQGVAAQMCPNQRTIGSTVVPDDQTDHFNSYSWTWWMNGATPSSYTYYRTSPDHRYWWDAPADAYMACGHTNCKRGMAVIPSLDLVATWNDTRLDQSGMDPFLTEDQVLAQLVSAVIANHAISDSTQVRYFPVISDQ